MSVMKNELRTVGDLGAFIGTVSELLILLFRKLITIQA